jgi:hypothetical protein
MDKQVIFNYALLFLFLGTIAFTMIFIGTTGAKKDNSSLTTQLTTLGVTNFVLILVFGFLSSYYLDMYPQAFPRYVFLMVNIALLLGLMAVSIASLNTL